MTIGILVRKYIPSIFRYCETKDHAELQRLMDLDYSRSVFGIHFPFCLPVSQIVVNQTGRYWTDTYIVRGTSIRVTSQWYDRNRQDFCEYLIRLGVTTAEELANPEQLEGDQSGAVTPVIRQPRRNARYKSAAIGNAQNAVIRNILGSLGHESFNENDWISTKAFFSNQCAYCGAAGDLYMDHVVPINRKSLGEHRIGNLVPSCQPCNAEKADKDYRDFLSCSPVRLQFIEDYMDSKNYVALGENEQVAMILDLAYKEVADLAGRYTTILNKLYPSGGQDDS